LAVMAGVAIWQAIDATRAKMVAEVQRDRAQRILDQVIAANNRRVQTETRRLHDNGVLYVAPGSAGDAATADSEAGVLLDKADALITQASKLIESENLKGARGPLELALNLLTSRPEAISNDTSWRLALLKAYDRMAVLREKAGDREDAFAEFNRALGLAESSANPQDTDWLHVVATLRQDLGDLHLVVATLRQDLGDLHSAQMHFDDAEKQYRLVLETRRTIVRDAPDSPAMKRDLAIAHTRLGDLQLKRSNPQAAQRSYAAALSIIEPMPVTRSGDMEFQRDLSAIYQQMGDALLAEHQYEAALDWLDRDLALSETLAP